MNMLPLLGPLGPRDALAFGLLVLAWAGIGWIIEHPPARRKSVSVLMTDYRREWMRQFVTRQPRIFDANVIDSLRQGTAFFASATMIAIGGGIALIGNSERLVGLAQDLTLAAEAVVIEIKVIVVLLFVANAFLKFVWAHRLFGYCAILMAAVPNDPADPLAYIRAAQAAEINITAARSFNRGLRAVYFALGALGWLLGPEALILATLATSAVTLRREFASVSRRVMLGEGL
ncbi:DUF599 domain-containing protein [Fertoebacter nigrum]|uniref:DUF599 domain-containing protein n=1 Tax=Fertoeibacter niger TaxID=2656921 RepID=A0A8X8H133_9RHOB|nr:DUF599 domain-containing protein [Fertoeibacter niger]